VAGLLFEKNRVLTLPGSPAEFTLRIKGCMLVPLNKAADAWPNPVKLSWPMTMRFMSLSR